MHPNESTPGLTAIPATDRNMTAMTADEREERPTAEAIGR